MEPAALRLHRLVEPVRLVTCFADEPERDRLVADLEPVAASLDTAGSR